MRTTLSVLGLCLGLVACDMPKSVGDEGTTTGGGSDPSVSAEGTGVAESHGESGGVTSGWPGSASATSTSGVDTDSAGVTTVATATTGGPLCGVDLSPIGGSGPDYLYECYCATCTLTYENISLETIDLFDEQNLCECLCPGNSCGNAQGEGGVGGGEDTATSSGASTGGDTDSGLGPTTGEALLTYAACIDQGGVIVGDPGDGSVFEVDYVCPGGESPIGWLEFEPGMPFPRNGGVCCPPEL